MPVIRIAEFDTWRPDYGFATVKVLKAGTTTLADIFTDEALTAPATNPQTLLEKTDGGISYGKFQLPLYTSEAYELNINTVDETGIVRPPLTTLDAQDASLATVMATGASQTATLADYLARRIDVRDYGAFLAVGQPGASASTNNNTIVAAIAIASARGGGYVEIPGGTYQFTDFSLPVGVVLRGTGRDGTILQSTVADKVVTITGSRAGFTRLTLDGISQVAGSVGVFAENIDQIVFDDAAIKRFDVGFEHIGGAGSHWRELYISDCATCGYRGHGDSDSGNGAALQFNTCQGGEVSLCAGIGIELENIDRQAAHITFSGLKFDSNTGTAVKLMGARAICLRDCQWTGNTHNLTLQDGSPLNANEDNTIVGFEAIGGAIDGGTIDLSGSLSFVTFRRVSLSNVTINLNTPGHNVVAEDCREITGVTFGGDTPTAWIRRQSFERGSASGLTTGNVATKAWGLELDAGQRVFLEGKVVARARNNADSAMYHVVVGAWRPGASLDYDTQTANFTAGNVLTGQTSGATARIAADSDSGATGTLTLQDVIGTFLDNEIITDTGGGSATVNGTLSLSDVVLRGSVVVLFAFEDVVAWDATFVANGSEVQLNVTGDTSMNVEWVVDVDVVSSNALVAN